MTRSEKSNDFLLAIVYNLCVKVATYNHMFGCDGRSLRGLLSTHCAHASGRHDFVRARADICATLKTVRLISPEVLAICEVLGARQREQLIAVLHRDGYSSFHSGRGHPIGGGEFVEVLLATSAPSTAFFEPRFNLPARSCFGGGIVGAHCDDADIFVIAAHAAIATGRRAAAHQDQIACINAELARIESEHPSSRVLVMGDFNCVSDELPRPSTLASLERLSSLHPTCSMTYLLRHFSHRAIDLILGSKFTVRANGIIPGRSDHALTWADVE